MPPALCRGSSARTASTTVTASDALPCRHNDHASRKRHSTRYGGRAWRTRCRNSGSQTSAPSRSIRSQNRSRVGRSVKATTRLAVSPRDNRPARELSRAAESRDSARCLQGRIPPSRTTSATNLCSARLRPARRRGAAAGTASPTMARGTRWSSVAAVTGPPCWTNGPSGTGPVQSVDDGLACGRRFDRSREACSTPPSG